MIDCGLSMESTARSCTHRFSSRTSIGATSYGDEVVFLSRIEPHKRQDLLVRALAFTRTPVRVRLCGAASSESYMSEIRELAESSRSY